ncbi:MAG: hypothetical protein Q8M94_03740 [Ignavibacteria bacterium]|nr:hypothetical protein [Ignavibacteria bacterium]
MKKIFLTLLVVFVFFHTSYTQITYPVRFDKQDSTMNVNESCILRINNGDLLFFWFEAESQIIFYSRSTDSGLNWQSKIVLVDSVGIITNYRNEIDAITRNDGTILFIYRSSYRQYILNSSDQGINWSVPRILPTRANSFYTVHVTNPKI